MHINDLPPELHAHIVAFACSASPFVDTPLLVRPSASPARALALVSRYWAAVARPFAFHALSFVMRGHQVDQLLMKENEATTKSAYGIQEVLLRLTRLPAHERCVRHLLIASSSSSLSQPVSSSTLALSLNDIGLQQDIELELPALCSLLSLLAPTLHTLSLRFTSSPVSTQLFSFVFGTPFPFLTALRLEGFYPFPRAPSPPSASSKLNASAEVSDLPPMVSNFPHLTSLTLSGVRNPAGLLSVSSPFSVCFPALASLAIHGISCAPAFAREVVNAVTRFIAEEDKDVVDPGGRRSRLPASLDTLTLSLLTVEPTASPSTTSNPHSRFPNNMGNEATRKRSTGRAAGLDMNMRDILGKLERELGEANLVKRCSGRERGNMLEDSGRLKVYVIEDVSTE